MVDGANGRGPSSRTDRDMTRPTSPDPRTPVIVVTGPERAGKAAMFGHLTNDPALARVVVVKVRQASGLMADQPPVDSAAGPGCVCCAVQGDLQRSLREWLPRARRGDISHIVADAPDAADPLPILTTLIADPVLAAVYRIGGVVAVIDRQDLRGMTALTRRQVTLADGIVIGDAAGADIAVRELNPVARLAWGLPDSHFILADERFGASFVSSPGPAAVVDVMIAAPLDWPALVRWLGAGGSSGAGAGGSNQGAGGQAWRISGVLRVAGESRPVAIEAVRHRLAPPLLLSGWPDGQAPRSRLICMGDALDAGAITASLQGCAFRLPAASG